VRDTIQLDVCYFGPRAEVSFCGCATVAGAVAYSHCYGAGNLQALRWAAVRS
jgi:predicted PhzF superfamily epimerase YddE/YHI9